MNKALESPPVPVYEQSRRVSLAAPVDEDEKRGSWRGVRKTTHSATRAASNAARAPVKKNKRSCERTSIGEKRSGSNWRGSRGLKAVETAASN